MDEIRLQQVLPRVFAQRDSITSDIWHRDLIFRKGERCLIEAASGTGKSSLCSYLYGYRGDYEGIITFDGKNIRSLDTAGWTALRRRSLSLLFQELRLFPELTALENVLLKNRLSGYKSRQEILTLFEAAGIADKVNEKNLFGMAIVLLAVQAYSDIRPVLTGGDSFLKQDYLIAGKKVGTLGSLMGKNSTFTPEEIEDLRHSSRPCRTSLSTPTSATGITTKPLVPSPSSFRAIT